MSMPHNDYSRTKAAGTGLIRTRGNENVQCQCRGTGTYETTSSEVDK